MRAPAGPLKNQKGFTLIEIIAALILSAVLSVILVQFMQTATEQSIQPIFMVQENLGLNDILERMNADYKRRLLLSPTPLADFKTDVETGNAPPDPYYGDYTVQTKWIKFTAGSEVDDLSGDNRILKVVVTKGAHSAVALFTK
jgi:prepilin-type N-terminal cleavage/methylation domain-containing protein